MVPRIGSLVLGIGALLAPIGCSQTSLPLSPEDALKSLRVAADLEIELFASEPYVVDPVELVFDHRGRAYVAEMLDYPFDPPPGEPAKSRVRLLVDRDRDGRVDSSTIFADNLLQTSSLLPWNGGLLVTAAPHILYLKDTDDDGRADVRNVLFTGFSLAHPGGRVTNLRFCIDNWIYAANSGQQGDITFSEQPDAPPVSVLDADFRFRLDRGLFEAASGRTQFGLALDMWGNRFSTRNSVHIGRSVMPRSYLSRNPFLVVSDLSESISDHGEQIFQLTPAEAWREQRTQIRQRRFQELELDRREEASGFFTGASGGAIYWGDVFPREYRGNLFTGDVAGHLVHRDILKPQGNSFVASRVSSEKRTEFLTSTDQWFRPCNVANGPDGNLYVVDMYRSVIEGPEFIPDELKKNLNFYAGNDRGRIYRIRPKNPVPKRKLNSFSSGIDSTLELVQQLTDSNGWRRHTAQRLLLERQDRSAVPHLQKLLTKSSTEAVARLHSLYALEGLSGLNPGLIQRVLQDTNPYLREHALRLAEAFQELYPVLLGMINDPSPRVRFQLALTLGEFSGTATIEALATLLSRYPQDRWLKTAVLSSRTGSSVALLKARLNRGEGDLPKDFLEDIGSIIGARIDRNEISILLTLATKSEQLHSIDHRLALFNGMSRGLKLSGARGLTIQGAEQALNSLLLNSSKSIRTAARDIARHFHVAQLIKDSMEQALNDALPTEKRLSAIRSLAGGRLERVLPAFDQLLSPQQPLDLVKATIQSLAFFDEPQVASLLIERWKMFGPESRFAVTDLLLRRSKHSEILLHAIDKGRIEESALDLPRRMKLLENPIPRIKTLAKRVLKRETNNRDLVVKDYAAALDLPSNPRHGRQLFEEHCANCHLRKRGKGVAPDLGRVKGKSKNELLEAILNPSSAISPFYTNYVIMTSDGLVTDGLIVSETPGTVTVKGQEGGEQALLRSQIVEIRASSVSLMPDGLEQDLNKQDLADVIAFLQGEALLE